jgi:hypothetical protein
MDGTPTSITTYQSLSPSIHCFAFFHIPTFWMLSSLIPSSCLIRFLTDCALCEQNLAVRFARLYILNQRHAHSSIHPFIHSFARLRLFFVRSASVPNFLRHATLLFDWQTLGPRDIVSNSTESRTAHTHLNKKHNKASYRPTRVRNRAEADT